MCNVDIYFLVIQGLSYPGVACAIIANVVSCVLLECSNLSKTFYALLLENDLFDYMYIHNNRMSMLKITERNYNFLHVYQVDFN